MTARRPVVLVAGVAQELPASDVLGPVLLATAVKTSNYTAAAGDLVPLDTTGGTFALTLPTAPPDGTTVAGKWTVGTTAPTVALGGSDVLNLAGGATGFTWGPLNTLYIFRYRATGAIWYVESSFSRVGLDSLYYPISVPVPIVSSATPSIAVGTAGANINVSITALAVAITSMTTNLTGTPVDFQRMLFRIKDNGTARAITWGASFESVTAALPTTTVLGKRLYVGTIYDSVATKWGCVTSMVEP